MSSLRFWMESAEGNAGRASVVKKNDEREQIAPEERDPGRVAREINKYKEGGAKYGRNKPRIERRNVHGEGAPRIGFGQ
jgi:hypothetical protein